MGLFSRHKSEKGNEHEEQGQYVGGDQGYQPPPGPPPSYMSQGSSSYPQQTKNDNSGPVHREEQYAPPPGPPPSYHDWQSIPDTSLLPPPPSIGHESSSTSNADEWSAQQAVQWCNQNPPFQPNVPEDHYVQNVRHGQLELRPPERLTGQIMRIRPGFSRIVTGHGAKDYSFLSSLPLYFERVDSPFRTERTKTIYYEMTIKRLGKAGDGSESSAAIGFCVAPYPTWRMPGWQRGSLAVHSDDGARYMNHDGGGNDFTTPITAGTTVGLGVRFSIPEIRYDSAPIDAAGQPLRGEVFFTRDGHQEGGWNIQEDLDRDEAWRAEFLDGKFDLYAVIGTYGEAEVTVSFARHDWMFQPRD